MILHSHSLDLGFMFNICRGISHTSLCARFYDEVQSRVRPCNAGFTAEGCELYRDLLVELAMVFVDVHHLSVTQNFRGNIRELQSCKKAFPFLYSILKMFSV